MVDDETQRKRVRECGDFVLKRADLLGLLPLVFGVKL